MSASRKVERVQTGLRVEKRILKVLKALADVHDMSLGVDLTAEYSHLLVEE